jgi:hypothetical protein
MGRRSESQSTYILGHAAGPKAHKGPERRPGGASAAPKPKRRNQGGPPGIQPLEVGRPSTHLAGAGVGALDSRPPEQS